MERNVRAFAGQGVDAVIHMATGCGATLQEYKQHLADDHGISDRMVEICSFVDRHWREQAMDPARDVRIMLHAPCTLNNCMEDPAAPARLLGRIPGARISSLDSDYGCCGAAGDHMISRPETARKLRAPLLAQAQKRVPDAIATTNPGCAMHLRQGLMELELDIPVRHPVAMLSDRIISADTA